MAKAVGACQGLGGVAKAVRGNPTLTLRPWGRSQGSGAWPKPWGRGQGRRGVAKVVGAWPRPWGRSQGRGGVAKAVRANPNPKPNAVVA